MNYIEIGELPVNCGTTVTVCGGVTKCYFACGLVIESDIPGFTAEVSGGIVVIGRGMKFETHMPLAEALAGYHISLDDECMEFRRNGEFHRDGGPARMSKWSIRWYKNGKLHRDGGPAVDSLNGYEWYTEGVLTSSM